MRIYLILSLCLLCTGDAIGQTIVLAGFEHDSAADIRYRLDSTIFNKLVCSEIPSEGIIYLPNENYRFLILCNYTNGHAAYFDIEHLSTNDTSVVFYSDYLSNAIPYQFPLFNAFNSHLCRYFFKEYSSLNIKIYDVWRSVSKSKLNRAINSGEIYSSPKGIFFDSMELQRLGYKNIEEAWLNLVPFCFTYGNFELIDNYFLNAGEKQSSIYGDTWSFSSIQTWSHSIFRNNVGPDLKDFIYKEFDKINSSPFPRYQRIKSLCLAYYAISAFGLMELNGGPYSISREVLYQQLNAMPQDIYTIEFRRILDDRASLTLDTTYIFTDQNHQSVKIDTFLGKEWLILDFWATWCKPCIKSFPVLKGFQEKHQVSTELVSLSIDVSHDTYAKWIQKRNKEYPWTFLHAGSEHPIINAMRVIAYPTYIIIHVPSGKVSGPFYKVEDLEKFFSSPR